MGKRKECDKNEEKGNSHDFNNWISIIYCDMG